MTSRQKIKTIPTVRTELVIANDAMRAGDYETAISYYELAITKNPTLARVIRTNIDLAKKKLNDINKGYSRSNTQNLISGKGGFHGRVAVFAAYSSTEKVEDYVLYYIKKLRDVADFIICVYDNSLSDVEKRKLNKWVDLLICERHEEYDFGSYKRAFSYLKSKPSILNSAEQLIFCNDSCYGPVNSFVQLFEDMATSDYDFWGLTQNEEYQVHLQSFFLVFSRNVVESKPFDEFMSRIKKEEQVQDVILNYEVKLTNELSRAGFSWGSYLDPEEPEVKQKLAINNNLTVFPLFLINKCCELIKVKALRFPRCNWEGTLKTADYLSKLNSDFSRVIWAHTKFDVIETSEPIRFSLILATYNRGSSTLLNSILSVVAQDYSNYELIIIDDGSSDNTYEVIKSNFAAQLKRKDIKYIKLQHNAGVSAARNIGLEIAEGDWIGFIDSDNQLTSAFLRTFADWIFTHRTAECFYANFKSKSNGKISSHAFDRDSLLKHNFIDLGAFVHRNLRDSGLRFDRELKRLVDWDYIIRFTENRDPVHIPMTLLEYNDSPSLTDRISVKESFNESCEKLRNKNNLPFSVSTVILTYNHEDYIEEAIESACSQNVSFPYEVIISDDCSTDRTWEIIAKLAGKYPKLIRGVRHETNAGQGPNFIRAMGISRSDFVAVLEGDDYWTNPDKIEKQKEFLVRNHDCSMVFSKILVQDTTNGTQRLLSRQDSLDKNKLDGSDFLRHPSMNLIGNFSSCMFRRYLIEQMPSFIFDERASEITVAFYLENFGKIGYLDEIMSVYRQHPKGLWTGASRSTQMIEAISARKSAQSVARQTWVEAIKKDIQSREKEMAHYSESARR